MCVLGWVGQAFDFHPTWRFFWAHVLGNSTRKVSESEIAPTLHSLPEPKSRTEVKVTHPSTTPSPTTTAASTMSDGSGGAGVELHTNPGGSRKRPRVQDYIGELRKRNRLFRERLEEDYSKLRGSYSIEEADGRLDELKRVDKEIEELCKVRRDLEDLVKKDRMMHQEMQEQSDWIMMLLRLDSFLEREVEFPQGPPLGEELLARGLFVTAPLSHLASQSKPRL